MNSCEKNARIVWRTKSVDVTRVMPSRYATSVATVDLPGAGAAADEQDDRQVELLQLAEAAQAPRRLGSPSSSPSSSTASSRSAVEVDRALARAPRGRARCGAPARTPCPRGRRSRSAPAPSAPSSTAGRPAAERSRAPRPPLPAFAHDRGLLREPQQLRVEVRLARVAGRTSLSASTTSTPRSRAASATTSIAAAFSSTRNDVRVDARELLAQRVAVGQAAGDVDDLGAVLVARGARRRPHAAHAPARSRRTRRGGPRRAPSAAARARRDDPRRRARRRGRAAAPSRAPSSAIVERRRGRRRGWR